MNSKIYITGIGTDVGKTVASAIVTKALDATYFKPIQCGTDGITDTNWVKSFGCNAVKELYSLTIPASPHIAAKAAGINIEIEQIIEHINTFKKSMIIEGAGGLVVPVNDHETFLDIIKKNPLPVIIVSRNYLGSINHSLLTAEFLKTHQIKKVAWLFNDQFMDYENDIVKRTRFPSLGHINFEKDITTEWIEQQAAIIKPSLLKWLGK